MFRRKRIRLIIHIFLLIIALPKVDGHGRMEDPPSRNAAWRYGFNVPANYDDVGLNCGGLSVQKANDGKCGICGDPFRGSRDHETGGKYATNTIVRHYLEGTLIDVKILLSANHRGFMEIRLCPVSNNNIEVTQECLDQYLLHIDGHGYQFQVHEGMDLIYFRAQLPVGLSCDRCVLQWRYHAGNNWGKSIATGQSCLGCGYQEEFYNCADISIRALPKPLLIPNVSWSHSFSRTTTTTPTVPPRASTELMTVNSLLSYYSILELINKNRSIIRCYPTNEALKPLAGIESWCLNLCAIHCPPTLCACEKV